MKKPQVVRFAAFVTVLAVLLGYVVYHRTGSNTTATKISSPTVSSSKTNMKNLENYFVNYRMHRDKVMTQEIATLKGLLSNPSISKTAKNQATQTLVRDTQELKQATQIEGILSGRGFPLNAATVTKNQVVVVVGAQHLTSQQVARIADTAVQVTGMAPQNVVILPKKN